jgi:hypothetical protein
MSLGGMTTGVGEGGTMIATAEGTSAVEEGTGMSGRSFERPCVCN